MPVSLDSISRSTQDEWAARLEKHLPLPQGQGEQLLAHLWGFPSVADMDAEMHASLQLTPPRWCVLPPLVTAKSWAKRTVKWTKAHGHVFALAHVQQAWARTWGLATWNGVPSLLHQAEQDRHNPWMRVSWELLTPALLNEMRKVDSFWKTDPGLVFWIQCVVLALRNEGKLDFRGGLGVLEDLPRITTLLIQANPPLEPTWIELEKRLSRPGWAQALAQVTPAADWVPARLLTRDERQALRDHLFAPEGFDWPFRFLSVEARTGGLSIHVAVTPADWQRLALANTPEELIRARLRSSPWATGPVTFHEHDHTAWDRPWALTAKQPGCDVAEFDSSGARPHASRGSKQEKRSRKAWADMRQQVRLRGHSINPRPRRVPR